MSDDASILLTILVTAAVTFILRLTPIVIMNKVAANRYVRYLGENMSVGIMILLICYTFIHTDFSKAPYGLPKVIAAFVVFLIYWYQKKPLLAMAAGLVLYLIFVNRISFF